MRPLTLLVGAALVLGLLVASPGSAQAMWDAPSFLRPGAPPGLTLALTDSEPGDGFGVLALWRGAAVPSGLGFRAGVSEAPGDDVAVSFPLGVAFSWAWVGEGISAMPYAGAHLDLDVWMGGRDALAVGVRIPG